MKSIHQSFIRPGTIWWLPVSFILDFPPVFLHYDEKKKELYTYDKNDQWCDFEDLSYSAELKEYKLVHRAKIRPFLVIQRQEMIKLLREYAIPDWYQKAVVGFPVSGVDNIEDINRDFPRKYLGRQRVEIDRLINKNDYEFIHYLPKSKYTKLEKDSYAVLAAMTALNIEYFTDNRFALEDEDYNSVKHKIKNYFSLG